MSDQTWVDEGTFEVLPGVFRIPLPLPGDNLKAVNVYAIRDDDGLVLIDSGWALSDSLAQLERSLATIEHKLSDISRFLVTHAHRDHYTQAVVVRQLFGSSVAIGIGEQPTLEVLTDPRHRPLTEPLAKLIRAGATEIVARIQGRTNQATDYRPSDWELPDVWLEEGPVTLRSRTLQAIHTPGHTAGHLVFHDPEAVALFAGDHVLPQITPSIGLEPAKSALPLVDYLDSLSLMLTLPDARLLPAHGPVTDSVHARVDQLLAHHERRLELSAAAIDAGADTAFGVAQIVRWTRHERHMSELDQFNQVLATTETLAHMDVLVARGWLTATLDAEGVSHYARP
jgi:glyoxylase-like metal-dependent hydrolase (beta-lactamase superfamily II)